MVESAAAGLKSPVTPEYETPPATAAPPGPAMVKVVEVMLAGSIASLKVAAKPLLMAMPLAPPAGLVALTVGPVAGVPPPPQAARSSAVIPAQCL